MQDINTINKHNADAFNDAVQAARRDGHVVVLEKQGLHVVGFKAFTDRKAATDHATAYVNEQGTSAHTAILEAL